MQRSVAEVKLEIPHSASHKVPMLINAVRWGARDGQFDDFAFVIVTARDKYEQELLFTGLTAEEPLTRKIRAALTFYCEDGRAEISNVLAENALRCVALGRKKHLFVGSDSGGERAAAMYSLIGTCKLNGINPCAYLEYVLTHIADYKISRIDELLAWNVADKLRPLTPPTLSTG
jgi:hypothetical protein